SAALRLALRLLGDGRAVLVFPEGTRGVEGSLQAARAGAGMLAALSGAPVLPVYVRGSGRALPKGAALPRPARVTVAFGEPIRFAKTRGRTRYQDVSDEIMAAIGRLNDNERTPGPRATPGKSNSMDGRTTGMDQFTQDPEAHATGGYGGGAGTGASPWEVGDGPMAATNRAPATRSIEGGSAPETDQDEIEDMYQQSLQ